MKILLRSMQLGDLVSILEVNHSFGRIYRQGAISVGIVTHKNCLTVCHGTGITSLMTTPVGKIIHKIDAKVNIACL